MRKWWNSSECLWGIHVAVAVVVVVVVVEDNDVDIQSVTELLRVYSWIASLSVDASIGSVCKDPEIGLRQQGSACKPDKWRCCSPSALNRNDERAA